MPETVIESVEVLVSTLLISDGLTMDLVAEASGVSKRTLQRGLSDWGRSYSDVVGDARIPARDRRLAAAVSAPALVSIS